MRTHFAKFIVLAPFMVGTQVRADDIDFNRDVRPILSDKCFFCHGPDGNTQEADLRLDSRVGAAEVIDDGERHDVELGFARL